MGLLLSILSRSGFLSLWTSDDLKNGQQSVADFLDLRHN